MDLERRTRLRVSSIADSLLHRYRRRRLSATFPERARPAILLAFCSAIAIIASSYARSPLLALMCCATALLSYQKGVRMGIVSAIIVTAIAFTLDPYAVHPFHLKMIASVVVLAIISVVSGDQYGRIVPEGTTAKAAPATTRSVRGLETPARGSRAIPEPRRSVAIDVEPESNVEQETISRFLREMRDQVGGDEVVLLSLIHI